MSKKAFIILTCLIIFFIILAKYNSQEMSKRSTYQNISLLNFDIEKVNAIKIIANDNILEFEKKDNDWLCKSKHNYNANNKKLNELLINLSELESSQQITSNENYFSKLSVSGENSISIELLDKNNILLSSINIGKIRDSTNPKYYEGAGQYVLPISKKTCYLISNPIHISKETTDWLNNVIFNLKKQEIDSISFLKNNPFKILNKDKENNKFHLELLKEGTKEKSWDIEQSVAIFENFSFNDIKPLTDFLTKIQKFEIILIIKTFEDIYYEISMFDEDEKSFIKINCTTENESIKEKVKLLNERFSNWIYELESWNASYLKKTYEDYTEPLINNEKLNNDNTQISIDENGQNEENQVEISPLKPELE